LAFVLFFSGFIFVGFIANPDIFITLPTKGFIIGASVLTAFTFSCSFICYKIGMLHFKKVIKHPEEK
jgi:hypothetical protein